MGLDLVEFSMAIEEAFDLRPGEGWTREEIKEIVDQLIVEVLEVEQFSEDAEFVRDMGVD